MAEWCTIESDPGVFTELIKNIGVKGVQVEEILDFDMISSSTEPVYGLVFLFKYIPNSGYNPNILSNYDEDIYFAQQVIVNACATQAILAILMNNEDKLDLGTDLTELKNFTRLMDPYMKGLSISNSDKIRQEHNKFARQEPFVFSGKNKSNDDNEDVFHFVAYINFKDNVYEIDGLREGPILIAENAKNYEWIEKVKPAIINRINLYASNEIKFNLLSVVPDRRSKAQERLLEIEEAIFAINLLLQTLDSCINEKYEHYRGMTQEDLINTRNGLEYELENNRYILEEENIKFEKYKIENERRQHNYIPLIFEMLKVMAEKNTLEEIYSEAKKEEENKAKNNNKNNKKQ